MIWFKAKPLAVMVAVDYASYTSTGLGIECWCRHRTSRLRLGHWIVFEQSASPSCWGSILLEALGVARFGADSRWAWIVPALGVTAHAMLVLICRRGVFSARKHYHGKVGFTMTESSTMRHVASEARAFVRR